MNNLFTINELINIDLCYDGLDRLTSGLGIYSGPTTVTIDDLEPMSPEDILWGLRLLPISDREQKVICVKVAVYAAELVAHLTDDPNATTCLNAAKEWLDNPCEETREAAAGAVRSAKARAGRSAGVSWAASAATWAASAATCAATWAADAAAAATTATTWATTWATTATMWEAEATMWEAEAARLKIKSYLINLIRELDQ